MVTGSETRFRAAVMMCAGEAQRDGRFSAIRPNAFGELGEITPFELNINQLGSMGVQTLVVVVPAISLSEYDPKPYAQEIVERYTRGRPEVQEKLIRAGKSQALIDAAGPHTGGIKEIEFVAQPPGVKGTGTSFGTAVPLLMVRNIRDVLLYNGDGILDDDTDVMGLIEEMEQNDAAAALLTTTTEKLHEGDYEYGVIMRRPDGTFSGINEGPHYSEVTVEEPEINVRSLCD